MTLLSLLAGMPDATPPDPTAPPTGTLCTIPTYDGSGKSIHPSVIDTGSRQWGGYRWWLADTPYALTKLENPSIFASHDRVNWVVPPGVSNPLWPEPPSGWNSDTELVWDDAGQRMIAFWRTNWPSEFLHAATSHDGATWTPQSPPIDWSGRADGGQPWVSPTIGLGPDGQWHMLMFGTVGLPRHWTAPAPLGPWTRGDFIQTPGAQPVNLWHGSMRWLGDRWLGVASVKEQWGLRLLASRDAQTWTITPEAWGDVVNYRATFAPSTVPQQMDVWYSTYATTRVTYTRVPRSAWPEPPPTS